MTSQARPVAPSQEFPAGRSRRVRAATQPTSTGFELVKTQEASNTGSTRDTGSGRVEVHNATAASGYQHADVHAATWFDPAGQNDGFFQMGGADIGCQAYAYMMPKPYGAIGASGRL